ncbi:MAG: biotin/lipoyl-binding protein [Clostridiales bacterium]|nr:biotin/lipoyl-binding protein [Clostridiales bacterium]
MKFSTKKKHRGAAEGIAPDNETIKPRKVKRAKQPKNNKKINKKVVIVVAAVLAVLISLSSVIGVKISSKQVYVTLAKAEIGSVQEVYETSALLKSSGQSIFNVYPGVVVNDVYVKVGDTIKAGDVLASFDTTELQLEVQKKKAVYETAKQAYEEAVRSAALAKLELPTIDEKIAELEAKLQSSGSDSETTAPSSNSSAVAEAISKLFGESQIAQVLSSLISMGGSIQQINDMIGMLQGGGLGSGGLSSLLGDKYQQLDDASQLMQLKTAKAIYEFQTGDLYVSSFKSVQDKAEKEYNQLNDKLTQLNSGFVATGNGKVSEVNIVKGQKVESAQQQAETPTIDIDTIMNMLSGNADISSLLSSFMNPGGSTGEIKGIVVENYDMFIATFQVGMYDAASIKVGMPAIVSYMDSQFDGEVTYIGATAKEGTSGIGSAISSLTGGMGGSSSYVEAKVAIKNPSEDLISGFNANIKINTKNVENAVVIPVDTLKLIDGEKYVYIYNENDKKIYQRKVEVGLSEETKYEIVSGLKPGEQIVRTFSSKSIKSLKDGMKVRISEKTVN